MLVEAWEDTVVGLLVILAIKFYYQLNQGCQTEFRGCSINADKLPKKLEGSHNMQVK